MTDFSKFRKEPNLIDRSWSGADNKATISVANSATGEIIGQVPNCGTAETERAIQAAAVAFKTYSRTDVSFWVGLLRKLHDALMGYQEALASLLTSEQGKPLLKLMGK